MEVLKVYYSDSGSKVDFTEEFAISDWYCKPAILSALAWRLGHDVLGFKVLFLTCTKYKSRKFFPSKSKSFPVFSLIKDSRQKNRPWLIIEFNSRVYDYIKD